MINWKCDPSLMHNDIITRHNISFPSIVTIIAYVHDINNFVIQLSR